MESPHNNTVELLGFYGSDEIIACSAWTSTNRNLTEEKRLRIGELIAMLASAGHHTPFEKGLVHFLVKTDIASHIHLLKHRISSLNAESARYKEIKHDSFYIPEDFKNVPIDRTKLTFQQNYMTEHCHNWAEILEFHTEMSNALYHACLSDVEKVHGRSRAKESARFFKPYNSQIEADVMFNFRSFINFLNLRRSEHAQREIYDIADRMLTAVKEIPENPFQHTLAAFGY